MLLPNLSSVMATLFCFFRRRKEMKERRKALASAGVKDLIWRNDVGLWRAKLAEKRRQDLSSVPVSLDGASDDEILIYAAYYLDVGEDPRISLDSLAPGK